MKIPTAILLSVLISCASKNEPSPTDLAQKSVKEYLSKKLHDFSSYQPVEFTIDRPKVKYRDTQDGIKLQTKYLEVNRYLSNLLYPEINKDSINEVLKDMQEMLSKRVLDSTSKDWHVVHSYRAKNSLGATVLNTGYFTLDSSYNVVGFTDEEPYVF